MTRCRIYIHKWLLERWGVLDDNWHTLEIDEDGIYVDGTRASLVVDDDDD